MKPETKLRNQLIKLYWQAFGDGRLWELNHSTEELLTNKTAREWRKEAIDPVEKTLAELLKAKKK